MGDSDVEFYSREAYRRGLKDGYAAATEDIRRHLKNGLEAVTSIRLEEPQVWSSDVEKLLVNATVDVVEGIIEEIDSGGHVGASKRGGA